MTNDILSFQISFKVCVNTFTESDSTISVFCEEHADGTEAGLRASNDDQVVLLTRRVTVHHAGRRQGQHRH